MPCRDFDSIAISSITRPRFRLDTPSLFSSSSSDRIRLASLSDQIVTAYSVPLLSIVLVFLSRFCSYPETSNQGEKDFIWLSTLLSIPDFIKPSLYLWFLFCLHCCRFVRWGPCIRRCIAAPFVNLALLPQIVQLLQFLFQERVFQARFLLQLQYGRDESGLQLVPLGLTLRQTKGWCFHISFMRFPSPLTI